MNENKLFSKYYYQPINIYSNEVIWEEIEYDAGFNKHTMYRSDYDKWVQDQENRQTEKIGYKPKELDYAPILAVEHSYQMDIMFMKEIASLNNRYDSILNIVEITTRKAYAYPLRYKRSDDVYVEFMKFYKTK